MRGFFRRISPKRAVLDFSEQWRQPTPHRWQILGVAMAMTFAIFMLFLPDTERAPPKRPEITWITTYPSDQTDEEIIASNIEAQKRYDERKAREEELAERKKEAYRALGRATFVDVDDPEAEEASGETEAQGDIVE